MELWNEAVIKLIEETTDPEWRNFLRSMLF